MGITEIQQPAEELQLTEEQITAPEHEAEKEVTGCYQPPRTDGKPRNCARDYCLCLVQKLARERAPDAYRPRHKK